MLCIGHRGAAGHAPENTVRSVRIALELGVAGIEIDVHLVGGELLVIHDDSLERTTNGRGLVSDRSVADLRSLDAGDGEKIPLLREVFDATLGRAFVNVELKGRNTALPTMALIARYIAEKRARAEDFLISSFDHAELSKLSETGIRLAPLWKRPPTSWLCEARALNAYSIHISLNGVQATFARQAHAESLKIFAYTANSPADIRHMEEMGVDGVFTDFPDRVISAGLPTTRGYPEPSMSRSDPRLPS